MKENKVGDYEENKEKLTCGKCGSSNIGYLEIKPYITKKVGIQAFFFGGIKELTYFAAYHCLDCNRSAFYPMPYYTNTNQKTTTKENTFELDRTNKIRENQN